MVPVRPQSSLAGTPTLQQSLRALGAIRLSWRWRQLPQKPYLIPLLVEMWMMPSRWIPMGIYGWTSLFWIVKDFLSTLWLFVQAAYPPLTRSWPQMSPARLPWKMLMTITQDLPLPKVQRKCQWIVSQQKALKSLRYVLCNLAIWTFDMEIIWPDYFSFTACVSAWRRSSAEAEVRSKVTIRFPSIGECQRRDCLV